MEGLISESMKVRFVLCGLAGLGLASSIGWVAFTLTGSAINTVLGLRGDR